LTLLTTSSVAGTFDLQFPPPTADSIFSLRIPNLPSKLNSMLGSSSGAASILLLFKGYPSFFSLPKMKPPIELMNLTPLSFILPMIED
jgi:hypothetical protein